MHIHQLFYKFCRRYAKKRGPFPKNLSRSFPDPLFVVKPTGKILKSALFFIARLFFVKSSFYQAISVKKALTVPVFYDILLLPLRIELLFVLREVRKTDRMKNLISDDCGKEQPSMFCYIRFCFLCSNRSFFSFKR